MNQNKFMACLTYIHLQLPQKYDLIRVVFHGVWLAFDLVCGFNTPLKNARITIDIVETSINNKNHQQVIVM